MNNKLLQLCCLCFCLLSACKNDPAPSQKTTPAFKRTSNHLIVTLDSEPKTLHPIISTSAGERQIYELLYSYLMVPDEKTLEYIPQLAKAKPLIAETTEGQYQGGMNFTFELHNEAVWDDGTPITGKDYIFALKSILNPGINAPRVLPYLEFIGDVKVDADNPKKITVFTREKYFMAEEAIVYAFPVLPAHLYDPANVMAQYSLADLLDQEKAERLYENNEDLQQFATDFATKFNRDPSAISGSGPYELVEWQDNQRLKLRKKENYWGQALANEFPALQAKPNEITFEIILDASTTTAALKSEELDVVSNFDANQFDLLQQDTAFRQIYRMEEPGSLVHYFLYMNACDPKLEDVRVRRALAHLVDVDQLIDVIFNGNGTRTNGPVHPEAEFYNATLPLIEYSPEKAKQILAEAGWTDTNGNGTVDQIMDGETVELSLSYLMRAGNERSRNIGELLIRNMQAGGVEIVLEPTETSLILDKVKRKEYELSTGGRAFAVPLWDPKQNWHTTGDNRICFGNASTDSIIDQIRVTFDNQKRNALYKELQAKIYEEQPLIFLFIPNNSLITHKRFDFEPTVMTPGYRVNTFDLNLETE